MLEDDAKQTTQAGCAIGWGGQSGASVLLLMLLGVGLSKRRRSGFWRACRRHSERAPILLVVLAMCLGSSSTAWAEQQVAAVSTQGCKALRLLCVPDCQAFTGFTTAKCETICLNTERRCCLPYNSTGSSTVSACADKQIFSAGFTNADSTPARCGYDDNCDGLDDCNSSAVSICCGDANCNGWDDCNTEVKVTSVSCPVLCGDLDCNGLDDCNTRVVSSCAQKYAVAVSSMCAATSNRVVGDIGTADLDVYKITAKKGEVIVVNLDAGRALLTGFDPLIRITDATGVVLATNDDESSTTRPDSYLAHLIPGNGGGASPYYVWITGYPDFSFTGTTPGTSTGQYTAAISSGTLVWTQSARGCSDAGGTIAAAKVLVSTSPAAAGNLSTCAGTCGVPYKLSTDPKMKGMVSVPAGDFIMGCIPWPAGSCVQGQNDNGSIAATQSAFKIDETEVTEWEYRQCIDAGWCKIPSSGALPSTSSNRAVAGINRQSAINYCAWVGKRLPSEAEWEKAARGPDGRVYPWGDTAPTCALANYGSSCAASYPTDVGTLPSGRSPYGALDMAGNATEWVIDSAELSYPWHSDPTAYNARIVDWLRNIGDPFGWYIVRGGGYPGALGPPSKHLHTTRRVGEHQDPNQNGSAYVGFRCAQSGCAPPGCPGPSLPDYVPTALTAPASVGVGTLMQISWTIANVGTGQSPRNRTDHVVYSVDPVFDASDPVLIGNGETAPNTEIPPGTSKTWPSAVWAPTVAAGSYYLILVTDRYDDELESNEANNKLVVPITFTTAKPDLTCAFVSAPASAVSGEPISASWTVNNIGTDVALGATSWYDYVYLSADPVYAFDCCTDPPVHFLLHNTHLAVGASYTVTPAAAKVPGVPAGS